MLKVRTGILKMVCFDQGHLGNRYKYNVMDAPKAEYRIPNYHLTHRATTSDCEPDQYRLPFNISSEPFST